MHLLPKFVSKALHWIKTLTFKILAVNLVITFFEVDLNTSSAIRFFKKINNFNKQTKIGHVT